MNTMMFKSVLLILALVACVAWADEDDQERPTSDGPVYHHRKRLGHLNREDFLKLYNMYAIKFIQPVEVPRLDNDHHRMFAPTFKDCKPFLVDFRTQEYKLRRLEHFIVLDACLGYLYDSPHHALDIAEEQFSESDLKTLIDDPELQRLYQGTKLNAKEGGTSPEANKCIADTLASAVALRDRLPDVELDSNWLQLFLQFAACQRGKITDEQRQSDTYISILYDMIRKLAQQCLDLEITYLNQAIRGIYDASYAEFTTRLSLRKQALRHQQRQRRWPSPVVRLLYVVQGGPEEISIRYVHFLLRGYYTGDKKLTKQLYSNLEKYATQMIKPKSKGPNDPMGHRRYKEKFVDRLCRFFRSADVAKYDFAKAFIRLVQMKEYEDVFGVSKEELIDSLFVRSYETASMYMSISACNILTFTQGTIVSPKSGSKSEYRVSTVPDTSRMVRWPDAGYY